MYIQLDNIRDLFQDFPCVYHTTDMAYNLNSFVYIHDNVFPPYYSLHTLHVLESRTVARKIHPPKDTFFLILVNDISEEIEFDGCPAEDLSIIKIQGSDIVTVCQRLLEFFDDLGARGMFADSMLEILFSEGGIQYMLDKTKPAFHNPIFVFDTDFRLLASTWEEDSGDEHGRNIIKAGGFTQAEYDILNKSRVHSKVVSSEYPIKVKHPDLGFEQLICAIDTKKDMGHIVLNSTNRPLVEEDQKLLYILKEAIDQQMKKDEFIRNNRGFNHEYFLRDILDGKMTVEAPNADRMNYVESKFYGNMFCMVIETARSLETINIMHVRSVFETSFPNAVSITYGGGIILIFNYPKGAFMTETEQQKIRSMCQQYGLYAGMGNCFSNILELTEYYNQALRSIELGVLKDSEPNLFLYKDNYMNHLSSVFRQKESPATFCNTKLKVLLEHDKKNNTSYAKTLYAYLTNERNIAATAKALFMHRNTLVYRLKKINDLVDIDYDDFGERQHIILSYELSGE